MSADPQSIIMLFSRGLAQRRLFGADHPKVRECQADLLQALKDHFRDRRHDAFFIGVQDGRLIYQGRYLAGSTITGGKLADLAALLRCGGFTFKPTVSEQDVAVLTALAAELVEPLPDLDTARRLLTERGSRGVELAAAYVEVDQFDPQNNRVWEGEQEEDDPTTVLVTKAMYEAVEQSHARAAQGRALDVSGVHGVAERLAQTPADGDRDLLQAVRYPDFDTYTVGHSVRLAVLAVMVARSLGCEQSVLTELGASALLHDVGKSKIPEEILFKPGRLDDDERAVMNTHAALGAEIFMENRESTPMVVAAAWGHHLHHGGGGYPELPFTPARSWVTALLQVCDVFEALTAVRPYKTSLSPRRAYEIMAANAPLFDPTALQAFVRAVGLYPPGCRVRLSDGALGTVLAAGAKVDRPRIHRVPKPGEAPGALFLDLSEPEQAHLDVVELVCGDTF